MDKKRGIYYGWYIVAVGCICLAMTTGVVNNCFSQFMKPVCADMGITRQQMSLVQTVFSFSQMFFAMMWGSLSKRIHLHKSMCVCAVMMPIIYACYGLMQEIWMGYIVSIAITPFFYIISMAVFNYIIGNWFVKNRGLAIGLASMGTGIGGMVMNTLSSQLIIHIGWRMTYFVLAAIMFVLVVPPVVLIVREKPEDKGLKPYGWEGAEAECAAREQTAQAGGNQSAAQTERFEGYTFAEAIRMPVFWAVIFCSVSMVVAIMSFYPTLAPHLSDCGYSVTFAATMTSVSMGALAIGKVTLGRMFDRLGNRTAVTIACLCTLAGTIAMIFCTSPIALVFIVLGVGLGCSFGAVCMPIIVQNIFGMKDYNSIYSKLTVATNLGSALAPVITGRTYDVCGSYVPAYIGVAVLTVISIIVLRVALPKEKSVTKK
ncbi:MAG: MFS transporter [Lachnospiraceae bacterium]|nr:MFS transporter [Lachnospiraceae bacterium]